MMPGARNLITDVDGILVGNVADKTLKSGVTVVLADAPTVASVHVMGGAPGTRETDLLAPDKTVTKIDAFVLSGGSAFGLAAADGVAAALREKGRGFEAAGHRIPIVPAAVLFDLAAGGDTGWTKNPYPALGRSALNEAGEHFELGSVGAGTGATTASLKGGLGSSSIVLNNGATVGALAAVNPVGDVVCNGGPGFWAAPFEVSGEFGGHPASGPAGPVITKFEAASATTLAVIATDATLTKAQCHRLAVAAQDGIARAIVPAHTPYDGDLVFALSTGRQGAPTDLEMITLCHAASTTLARAIARGVYEARSAPGDTKPTWQDRFAK
ncbi:MAG: P1 family peptidase [Pseudomonadota bacterium]